MFKLIKIRDSFLLSEYRIEGLTDTQVLRIYDALKMANSKGFCPELDVMVKCLKMDMDKLNKLI